MRRLRGLLATIAGGALAGGAAGAVPKLQAQANLDSLRAAHSCEAALRIVKLRHPDRNEDWAWSMLPGCGAAATGVARDVWLAQRFVTDTIQLATAFGRLWTFRDSSLFEAAMNVASDHSAATPSRVFSMMMLLEQLFDRPFAEYKYFAATRPTGVCRIGSVYDREIHVGVSLAADARQRVLRLAQALESDASLPPEVQSAGLCVDQALTIEGKVRGAKPIRPAEPQGN